MTVDVIWGRCHWRNERGTCPWEAVLANAFPTFPRGREWKDHPAQQLEEQS